MMAADCIFCKISRAEIPAKIVAQNEDVLAFEDIHPQAPVHLLIIPRVHLSSINDLDEKNQSILGKMALMAKELAVAKGISSGYRLVTNIGAQAGQSVFHLHLHLLGGRPMEWPPG